MIVAKRVAYPDAADMHTGWGEWVVQEIGCKALVNLAANHPANQAAIAVAGGVECVIAAMRVAYPDVDDLHTGWGEWVVQEIGCKALENLASNHPANQAAIAAGGGVECVIAAMRVAYPDADDIHGVGEWTVQEIGCKALGNLAVKHPANPAAIAGGGRRGVRDRGDARASRHSGRAGGRVLCICPARRRPPRQSGGDRGGGRRGARDRSDACALWRGARCMRSSS